MINKSALERAVYSVLKDNGITSLAKREMLTRALVDKIGELEPPKLKGGPVGRPNRRREDYDRLRQIDFKSMTELTPEMLPVARRLVTVDSALRKSGASDEVLGDRTQVRAAARLASAFQRAKKIQIFLANL
jgi:hypothetical protein